MLGSKVTPDTSKEETDHIQYRNPGGEEIHTWEDEGTCTRNITQGH